MTFAESKETLKENYLKNGFILVDEHEKELYIEFNKEQYIIDEDEIEQFMNSQGMIATLNNFPCESSICSPTYREQIIRRIDANRMRASFAVGREYYFGEPIKDQLHVVINLASPCFVNFFRFNDSYLQICKDRTLTRSITSFGSVSKPGEKKRLFEYLYRPRTIQVNNMEEPNIDAAIKHSNELIDSCLFGLTYVKNIPLGLVETFDTGIRPQSKRHFTFGERDFGNKFPLPNASYRTDLIRFYQFGASSDIPILQFLAFYQILEYFFVSVSDEHLYTKLSARINDFKFRTSPNHLDRVIQDVLEHSRVTDETEMLKNVIKKYIDEDDVIKFIKNYEEHLGDSYYTKKHEIFGVSIEVKLNPGHVVGNIAKLIKTVRNALVHSSDRHERSARHIPFSKSTEIVEREVPLVRFLAEKIMTATATQRI